MTQEERAEREKKKGGGYRNEIVQEKIDQERETGITLTNSRE